MGTTHERSPAKGSPYDGHWRKVRKEAIEKAEHRCQVCGVKRKRLEVDHILGVRNDPEHKKLMVMCPSCHEIKTTLARRTKHPYTRDQLLALLHLSRVQQGWNGGSEEVYLVMPLKQQQGGASRAERTRSTTTSTGHTSTAK